MAQQLQTLDTLFTALADPTRRAVMQRLGRGPASISDLARPFDMALPSFLKHIRFLEAAGLVTTEKRGRVRHCRLEPSGLREVQDWLEAQRLLWEGRADRLEAFVMQDEKGQGMNPELDLTISRIIRAPRAALWSAWTDPQKFSRWWVPEPARCEVAAMELVPGGSFETRISEGGAPFSAHISGCFLAVEPMERIVFTTALVKGWRPAETPFITAIIRFADHPEGTEYSSHVMHKDAASRAEHEAAGFQDGWGTVITQLARMVERV